MPPDQTPVKQLTPQHPRFVTSLTTSKFSVLALRQISRSIFKINYFISLYKIVFQARYMSYFDKGLLFFFFLSRDISHQHISPWHLSLSYLSIITDTTGFAESKRSTVKVSGEILIYLTGACLESFIFSIPVMPKFFPPAGMTLIFKL